MKVIISGHWPIYCVNWSFKGNGLSSVLVFLHTDIGAHSTSRCRDTGWRVLQQGNLYAICKPYYFIVISHHCRHYHDHHHHYRFTVHAIFIL